MRRAWLFVALLAPAAALGQVPQAPPEPEPQLALIGIWQDGAVLLRWATSNTVVWRHIRANGVLVEKQEADGPGPRLLNDGQPLRVRGEDAWRGFVDTLVAAQMVTLLRDDEPERAGLSEVALADLEQNKLTALLLLAEFRFAVAEGLALGYRDPYVQEGRLYRYRVLVPDPATGDTVDAEAYVSTAEEPPLPPPIGLQARAGDGFIDLVWERWPIHSGYLVERRDAEGGDWSRLTEVPKVYDAGYRVPYLHRDSVPNYRRMEYRVRGVDAFSRLSPPSEGVEQFARDLTPPRPPYALESEERGGRVRITWTTPPSEPDLAGYGLLRSTNPDDGYAPVRAELLPPGTASASDSLPGPGTYFYRLVAADTTGNVSMMSVRTMLVVEDTVAPPAPENLGAVADTGGVITLRWSHHPEPDVAGYRVYRLIRGGMEREFVPLTPGLIVDSVFTDTLPAHARDRFVYRIRAVDFAGNYSAPSAEADVHFPDLTPPTAPVLDGHSAADRQVHIRFVSASPDVAWYEILRWANGAAPERVGEAAGTTWTDSTAAHGHEYRYEVVAVDSAGNRSPASSPLFVRPLWSVELRPPPPPRLRFDPIGAGVVIEWDFPAGDGWSAVVFRRSGDGPPLQVSPQLSTPSFFDPDAGPGRHSYALRFYLRDQGATPLGESAQVEVPASPP